MKVNLTECTVKTGGEVYSWSESGDSRFWDRIRKAYIDKDLKKYVHVHDPKLIVRLDAAVDHAVEKRDKKTEEEFKRSEAKNAKAKGDGVRIYSQDGKRFLDVLCEQDSKDSDLAHLRIKADGKWKYHWAIEGIGMDLLEDTIRGWRSRD